MDGRINTKQSIEIMGQTINSIGPNRRVPNKMIVIAYTGIIGDQLLCPFHANPISRRSAAAIICVIDVFVFVFEFVLVFATVFALWQCHRPAALLIAR